MPNYGSCNFSGGGLHKFLCTMYFLGKMKLETKLQVKGVMKCIRDFKNDRFGKTIVLCGKCVLG
jgi:hypothetical protein